jgi:hypothetical protein
MFTSPDMSKAKKHHQTDSPYPQEVGKVNRSSPRRKKTENKCKKKKKQCRIAVGPNLLATRWWYNACQIGRQSEARRRRIHGPDTSIPASSSVQLLSDSDHTHRRAGDTTMARLHFHHACHREREKVDRTAHCAARRRRAPPRGCGAGEVAKRALDGQRRARVTRRGMSAAMPQSHRCTSSSKSSCPTVFVFLP